MEYNFSLHCEVLKLKTVSFKVTASNAIYKNTNSTNKKQQMIIIILMKNLFHSMIHNRAMM